MGRTNFNHKNRSLNLIINLILYIELFKLKKNLNKGLESSTNKYI